MSEAVQRRGHVGISSRSFAAPRPARTRRRQVHVSSRGTWSRLRRRLTSMPASIGTRPGALSSRRPLPTPPRSGNDPRPRRPAAPRRLCSRWAGHGPVPRARPAIGSPGRRRLAIGVRSFLIEREPCRKDTMMRLRYLAAAPLLAAAMFGTTAAAWPSASAARAAGTARADLQRAVGPLRRRRPGDRNGRTRGRPRRRQPLAGALATLRTQQVLFFDPRPGVAAMVIGNLATATRVAIWCRARTPRWPRSFPGIVVPRRRCGGARLRSAPARPRPAG